MFKVLTFSIILFSSSMAHAVAYRTCVPERCSQEQATFSTLEACVMYRGSRPTGSGYSICFQVP